MNIKKNKQKFFKNNCRYYFHCNVVKTFIIISFIHNKYPTLYLFKLPTHNNININNNRLYLI